MSPANDVTSEEAIAPRHNPNIVVRYERYLRRRTFGWFSLVASVILVQQFPFGSQVMAQHPMFLFVFLIPIPVAAFVLFWKNRCPACRHLFRRETPRVCPACQAYLRS